MTAPRFSAVVPTRGDAPHLRVALDSVLSCVEPLEVLLVHDRRAGEPELPRHLFADPRVRPVAHPSTGVSDGRNAGIAAAAGRFVALLDDDDAWLPGHLERAASLFARHPSAVLVGADALIFDDDTDDGSAPRPAATENLRRTSPGRPEGPVGLRDLLLANMFQSSAVVLDRERLAPDERFDPRIAHMEDYDLWLRLARRRTVVFDPRPGALIRKHARNASGNWRRMAAGSLEVLDRFLAEGVPEGTIDKSALDRRIGRLWHDLAYACLVEDDTATARLALDASSGLVPGFWKNGVYRVALGLPPPLRRLVFARGRRLRSRGVPA